MPRGDAGWTPASGLLLAAGQAGQAEPCARRLRNACRGALRPYTSLLWKRPVDLFGAEGNSSSARTLHLMPLSEE
jgi:hypothetical protein